MILDIKRLPEITIGHETDNLTNTIEIDVRPWKRNNPGLDDWNIVVHSPNGDTYLAPEVVERDGILSWIITDSDTAYPGKGTYEVVAKGVNGESISSGPVKMRVADRTKGTASETPPEAAQGWVDKVLDAAQRAEEAAERAEEGGGMPSGATANQWLVSDSDAVVKWEEKPFYTERAVGTVLPELNIRLSEGQAKINGEIGIMFSGETYTVNWKGTDYICTCQELEMDGITAQILGNVGALMGGEDTGEPFLFIKTPVETGIFALDGSIIAPISITGLTDVTHQIPRKYLPVSSEQNKIIVNLDTGETSITAAEAARLDVAELCSSMIVIYEGDKHSVSSIHKIIQTADNMVSTSFRVGFNLLPSNSATVKIISFKWHHDNDIDSIVITDGIKPLPPTSDLKNTAWLYGLPAIQENYGSELVATWRTMKDFAFDGIMLKSTDSYKEYWVTVDDTGTLTVTDASTLTE